MKNLSLTSVALLTLLLMAVSNWSCQAPVAEGCNISAEDFTKADLSDVVIIDVRLPIEYNKGHFKGAQSFNISSSEFESKIGELDKSAKYFVYCRTGGRSCKAVNYMVQNGFTNVCNILGGLKAVQATGLTLEK